MCLFTYFAVLETKPEPRLASPTVPPHPKDDLFLLDMISFRNAEVDLDLEFPIPLPPAPMWMTGMYHHA